MIFFSIYFDWCTKTLFGKCLICKLRQFYFSKILHPWFIFQISSYSYDLFESPNKIWVINMYYNNFNLVSICLIKMHEKIKLFAFLFFITYFLRLFYHILLVCFNSIRIVIYIEREREREKERETKRERHTHMRHIFNHSETTKLIIKIEMNLHPWWESIFPYSQY